MESTGFDDSHQILLTRRSMVVMLLLFLSLSVSDGLVAAPNLPPGAPVPVLPPLPVTNITPPRNAPTQPPAINPSPPLNARGPSPPNPSAALKSNRLAMILGLVLFGGAILAIFIWKVYQMRSHPILFFLAHSAGADESTKNFAERLSEKLRSTWRYKLRLIKVFFDRSSLTVAEDFTEEINQALEETRVGVVIITRDFFERKWPMTELLSFVESRWRNPKKVRILPLFYKLKVDDVRDLLARRSWDERWRQMSTENHPMDLEMCRVAVATLCKIHGIEYNYNTRGHDAEYIEKILRGVGETYNNMVL